MKGINFYGFQRETRKKNCVDFYVKFITIIIKRHRAHSIYNFFGGMERLDLEFDLTLESRVK